MRNVSNWPEKLVLTFLFAVIGSCTPSPPQPQPRPTFDLQLDVSTDLVAYRAKFPPENRSGSHIRSRLSTECSNCWTNVKIEAYAHARHWGAENFPANPGGVYPIGSITNLGNHPTVMYSLEPSTVKDYRIFITNDNGAPGWAIVESSPTALTGVVKIKARGKLKGCHHSKKPKSEADFRNCDYEVAGKSTMKLASLSGLDIISRFMSRDRKGPAAMEDPGWISCTEGCCTMDLQ